MVTNFSSILDNLHNNSGYVLNTIEVNYVMQLSHKYPYFQIAHSLIAKANPDERLYKNALLHSVDADYVSKIISGNIELVKINHDLQNSKKLTENHISAYENSTNIESEPYMLPTDSLDENKMDHLQSPLSTYVDEIFKLPAKMIDKKENFIQFSIVSRFIKYGSKNLKTPLINQSFESVNIPDSQNYSSLTTTEFFTVPIFKIYLDQGKIDEAINIYHQIVAKNPEKKLILDSMLCKKSIEIS